MLSPDGSRVVLVATGSDSRTRLWVRSLDREDTRLLAGTVGALHPFWSPDGKDIAFFADGKLKRVSARILFDARLGVLPYDLAEYDSTPDGQRFLVNQSAPPPRPRGGQPALRLDGEAAAVRRS